MHVFTIAQTISRFLWAQNQSKITKCLLLLYHHLSLPFALLPFVRSSFPSGSLACPCVQSSWWVELWTTHPEVVLKLMLIVKCRSWVATTIQVSLYQIYYTTYLSHLLFSRFILTRLTHERQNSSAHCQSHQKVCIFASKSSLINFW